MQVNLHNNQKNYACIGIENGTINLCMLFYSFFRRVSFGSMVACENPECAIEWFHFECVGLKNEVCYYMTDAFFINNCLFMISWFIHIIYYLSMYI